MQKIFYNAKIQTFNENLEQASAMLINEDNVVLTGTNNEILSMKTNETEVFDLDGKVVFPSFFDVNANVFEQINTNLKNAKLDNFIENFDEIDQNYEKFSNFNIYFNEFLKIQDALIKSGVTTIYEFKISCKEFIFWKKVSELKALKIEVVGFVDMINFKFVMDENCKSFRKCRNNFRLGGYSLSLDGKIFEKQAWIKKPYLKEGKYKGYAKIIDEQLLFLIKNSADEKKQLVIEANGDEAAEQFLRCYAQKIEGKEKSDLIRPVILTSSGFSKETLSLIKKLDISIIFDLTYLKDYALETKRAIGFFRFKKLTPVERCKNFKINFSACLNSKNGKLNFFDEANLLLSKLKRKKCKSGENLKAFEPLIKGSAFLCYDDQRKGSLESGKLANFVVFDTDDVSNLMDAKIFETYIGGNCEFSLKNKSN